MLKASMPIQDASYLDQLPIAELLEKGTLIPFKIFRPRLNPEFVDHIPIKPSSLKVKDTDVMAILTAQPLLSVDSMADRYTHSRFVQSQYKK